MHLFGMPERRDFALQGGLPGGLPHVTAAGTLLLNSTPATTGIARFLTAVHMGRAGQSQATAQSECVVNRFADLR
jgi:hypothetical protein